MKYSHKELLSLIVSSVLIIFSDWMIIKTVAVSWMMWCIIRLRYIIKTNNVEDKFP